jgi:PPOX class probable F420-dependent enzyme
VAEPIAQRPHMPGYGVDAPDWQPLPWPWAAARLAATRNFWVVTVSGDGRPHALPVWGVWNDDDLRFCFACAPGARKARNLDADPHVVVATSDTVECISIEGTARRIDDDRRRDDWIDRYLAKYREAAPDLDADFLAANAMFEFAPERAFAIIERDDEFSSRATKWVFD